MTMPSMSFECKGSLRLGTGCRECSRCFAELEASVRELEKKNTPRIPVGTPVGVEAAYRVIDTDRLIKFLERQNSYTFGRPTELIGDQHYWVFFSVKEGENSFTVHREKGVNASQNVFQIEQRRSLSDRRYVCTVRSVAEFINACNKYGINTRRDKERAELIAFLNENAAECLSNVKPGDTDGYWLFDDLNESPSSGNLDPLSRPKYKVLLRRDGYTVSVSTPHSLGTYKRTVVRTKEGFLAICGQWGIDCSPKKTTPSITESNRDEIAAEYKAENEKQRKEEQRIKTRDEVFSFLDSKSCSRSSPPEQPCRWWFTDGNGGRDWLVLVNSNEHIFYLDKVGTGPMQYAFTTVEEFKNLVGKLGIQYHHVPETKSEAPASAEVKVDKDREELIAFLNEKAVIISDAEPNRKWRLKPHHDYGLVVEMKDSFFCARGDGRPNDISVFTTKAQLEDLIKCISATYQANSGSKETAQIIAFLQKHAVKTTDVAWYFAPKLTPVGEYMVVRKGSRFIVYQEGERWRNEIQSLAFETLEGCHKTANSFDLIWASDDKRRDEKCAELVEFMNYHGDLRLDYSCADSVGCWFFQKKSVSMDKTRFIVKPVVGDGYTFECLFEGKEIFRVRTKESFIIACKEHSIQLKDAEKKPTTGPEFEKLVTELREIHESMTPEEMFKGKKLIWEIPLTFPLSHEYLKAKRPRYINLTEKGRRDYHFSSADDSRQFVVHMSPAETFFISCECHKKDSQQIQSVGDLEHALRVHNIEVRQFKDCKSYFQDES